MPFYTPETPVLAEVASDVTHTQSDTSLEDVTGMSFSVVNGGTYSWLLFLNHNSSAVADLDIAYSVPAGAGRHGQSSSANGTNAALTTEIFVSGGGADRSVLMFGHYQPTADGTIQLQFAQSTSEATNTVILDGTTLVVWQSA